MSNVMQHGKVKVPSLQFESRGGSARTLSPFWGHGRRSHAKGTRARWAQARVVGAASCHMVACGASGAPASRAMQVALKAHRGKFREGRPGGLALATMHNKSANTDRGTAGFACLRAAGCLQR